MARDKELTTDEKFEMLIAALSQRQDGGSITKDDLAEILQANSKSLQKAMKPENESHPGISVFRPKGGSPPDIGFKFFYFNYPVSQFPETQTDAELALASQLKAGKFTVLRKDGTPMQIEVSAKQDVNGKTEEMSVGLPAGFSMTKEDKTLLPPMEVMLYQLVHSGEKSARAIFVTAMQQYLATMDAEAVEA